MTAVVYVPFKKNQNKADLEKEKTEQWNARLEVIGQDLEDSLNQSQEPSEESNLEPTATAEKVVFSR